MIRGWGYVVGVGVCLWANRKISGENLEGGWYSLKSTDCGRVDGGQQATSMGNDTKIRKE